MILGLFGLLIIAIFICAVCYGLGAFLGIITLFTHPIRFPKPVPAPVDAYVARRTKLSKKDARYQSREYKPPRG